MLAVQNKGLELSFYPILTLTKRHSSIEVKQLDQILESVPFQLSQRLFGHHLFLVLDLT